MVPPAVRRAAVLPVLAAVLEALQSKTTSTNNRKLQHSALAHHSASFRPHGVYPLRGQIKNENSPSPIQVSTSATKSKDIASSAFRRSIKCIMSPSLKLLCARESSQKSFFKTKNRHPNLFCRAALSGRPSANNLLRRAISFGCRASKNMRCACCNEPHIMINECAVALYLSCRACERRSMHAAASKRTRFRRNATTPTRAGHLSGDRPETRRRS